MPRVIPDLAGEIREFFPVLGLVEDFKPGNGDLTGSIAGPTVPGIGTLLDRLGDLPIYCGKSAAAAWGSSTRPSKSRWAVAWP